jgi:hypothetical protein
MFLVHWKGYDRPSDHTWEPLENLFGCLDLVAQFNATKGAGAMARSDSPGGASKATSSGTEGTEPDFDPEPPRRPARRPPAPRPAAPRRQALKRPPPRPATQERPVPCESVVFPASIPRCDQWFTECLFDETPGKLQPQIAAVIASRRYGTAIFFECLFDTGDRLWMSAREAQARAPDVLQRYLAGGRER